VELDLPHGLRIALELVACLDAGFEISVGQLELVGAIGLAATDPLAAHTSELGASRSHPPRHDDHGDEPAHASP
jgi:hypothetical protein